MKQQQAVVIGVVLLILVTALGYMYVQQSSQSSAPVERSLPRQELASTNPPPESIAAGNAQVTLSTPIPIAEGELATVVFHNLTVEFLDTTTQNPVITFAYRSDNNESTSLTMELAPFVQVIGADEGASTVASNDLEKTLLLKTQVSVDALINNADKPVTKQAVEAFYDALALDPQAQQQVQSNMAVFGAEPTTFQSIQAALNDERTTFTLKTLLPITLSLKP